MDLLSVYRQHPFLVLDATPQCARDELMNKQSEAALFGEEQASADALTALLHPDSRLNAEIHWFPQTEREQIQAILQYAFHPILSQPAPEFSTPSFLAQFNALRLLLSLLPVETAAEYKGVLHSLSMLGDCLLPRQVMDEINLDRKASGFPPLRKPTEMEPSIVSLLHETALAFLEKRPAQLSREEIQKIVAELRKDYKDRSSIYHNSYFLEIISDELAALPG